MVALYAYLSVHVVLDSPKLTNLISKQSKPSIYSKQVRCISSCFNGVEAVYGLRTFRVNVCEQTLHVKGRLELIMYVPMHSYAYVNIKT